MPNPSRSVSDLIAQARKQGATKSPEVLPASPDDTVVQAPIHRAAAQGDLAAIQQLLAIGIDINATCSEGMTPLGYALRRHHVGIAMFLIDAGADVNSGTSGIPPLHDAVSSDNQALIDRMLDAGADIHARSKSGYTVLIQTTSGSTIKLLLNRGADIDLCNDAGRTASEEHRYQADACRRDLERARAHRTKTIEAASYDPKLQETMRSTFLEMESSAHSTIERHELAARYLEAHRK